MSLKPCIFPIRCLVWGLLPLSAASALAQQSYNGSSGYINTPSAVMRNDGDVTLGYSFARPYSSLYIATQILPRLEVTGRYTRTMGVGVPAFQNASTSDYGDFKDKAFGAKLLLWREGEGWLAMPSIAVGYDDFFGTRLYSSYYAVVSRHFRFDGTTLQGSLGYGRNRIDGVFGGLRVSHEALPGWSLVGDYDRINFKNDFGADQSGVDQRKVGRFNAALEYASPRGWSVQLGQRDGRLGVNVALTAPFGQRTLAPKAAEPAPYVGFQEPVTIEKWGSEDHLKALINALHQDGVRQAQAHYEAATLSVSMTSNRYIEPDRAVGRALRILQAYAPSDTRRIEVTYKTEGMPTLRYSVTDTVALQRYFNGAISLAELDKSLQVTRADSANPVARDDLRGLYEAMADNGQLKTTEDGTNAGFAFDTRIGKETADGHSFSLAPQVRIFFNDPSGAWKGALNAEATGHYQIQPGFNIEASANYRVFENITDVTQPSNSTLPHVRSDIAEYYRGSRYKIDQLLVNRFVQPADGWYGRLSAGFYEMMYAGTGFQLMYVPPKAGWSADLSVDYLAQRDFSSPFKFRDYRTTTALGSVHADLPFDITGTVRVGRFLARDTGARFELKREFPSGVQIGAWYTYTNGKDTTGPGRPDNPYYDKGIFMTIPLDAVANRHSRRILNMSISPWTRDVGQMVQSPADLRVLLEQGAIDRLNDRPPFSGFGGVDAGERR